MEIQQIIQQIKKVLQHLEAHIALANIHMVDYFTKNVFIDYIPNDIQEEVNKFGYGETLKIILNQETSGLPCLNEYIMKSRELTLKNIPICLSFDQFETKLDKLGCEKMSHLKLDMFMNAKKSHEVEVLSGVAAAIHNLSKTTHVIDIGDGKGYLSSMLALNYHVPVLGVDASAVNTNSALERATKLSKVWNGVVANIKTRKTSVDLYKQITKFVDENVDFQELVSNVFIETTDRIGLVGLHTCGNLASTCLKIYKECNEIKSICNIGCCYQHLTEQFTGDNISAGVGFPLSSFLKNKKCQIGSVARMIAVQSMERILETKEVPSKTLFYRALFEVIIEQSSAPLAKGDRQVGRFRKRSPHFLDYVKKASERINLTLELSDEEICLMYAKFEHRIDEMNLFYLIRAMIAPVIESLILLDRLLFLHENHFENSFLVHFFDPVISPRCYGIVSIKN